MCSSRQHPGTPTAAADAKDRVQGRATAEAPAGCVAEASVVVAAVAPTPAPGVSDAVGGAATKEAAHGQRAGRTSTGRGAGTEIRDRSLPGTVDGKKPRRGR